MVLMTDVDQTGPELLLFRTTLFKVKSVELQMTSENGTTIIFVFSLAETVLLVQNSLISQTTCACTFWYTNEIMIQERR